MQLGDLNFLSLVLVTRPLVIKIRAPSIPSWHAGHVVLSFILWPLAEGSSLILGYIP